MVWLTGKRYAPIYLGDVFMVTALLGQCCGIAGGNAQA
jgi:hypothetical protein